jgi:hypothetical protein
VARLRQAPLICVSLCALACSELRRECDAVVKTANAFISDSARHRPLPNAPPEQAAREALETADRYDKLARDLAAIRVTSDELRPDVERYAALAVRSSASLRAAAQALRTRHFEQARKQRVELDAAAKSEGPLVARINATCGR